MSDLQIYHIFGIDITGCYYLGYSESEEDLLDDISEVCKHEEFENLEFRSVKGTSLGSKGKNLKERYAYLYYEQNELCDIKLSYWEPLFVDEIKYSGKTVSYLSLN